MKVKAFAVVLIIILGTGVWWGFQTLAAQKQAQAPNTADITKASPQFDTQGGVDVSVTWEKEDTDSSMQKFEVTMNNHMINLDDFDFTKNTELMIDGTIVPTVVKVLNKSGAGHHVSAEIGVESPDLNKLEPGSQFTLVIKNVANIPMRNFSWAY